MNIRIFDPADRAEVVSLWNRVFPYSTGHNDPDTAIDRKLAAQDDLFFVVEDEEAIVGTVMLGYDGHRGWMYSLAVQPDAQRKRIGTELVRHSERVLATLGCPKLNLQVRGDNSQVADFYRSLGFQMEDRISMGKMIGAAS